MNKNKLLITLYLVLIISSTVQQMASASDCNSFIKKYYRVKLTAEKSDTTFFKTVPITGRQNTFGVKEYNGITETCKGLGTSYPAMVNRFSLQVNCDSVSFKLPLFFESQLIDDNFKEIAVFCGAPDFDCQGSIGVNNKITGSCGQTSSVDFTTYVPTPFTSHGMTSEPGSYTFPIIRKDITVTFIATPINASSIPANIRRKIQTFK